MIVLGVDISYKSTGFAVLDIGPKKTKVLHTNLFETEGEQIGQLYNRFCVRLKDIISKYKVEEIVIEDLNIQYLKVAKKILPLHGLAKYICHFMIQKEATAYNVSTYRFKILNIKKFSKEEKAAITELELNKAQTKSALDIKRKVIKYVNKRLKTNYSYDDNDITDAIALCLAYGDEHNEPN